MGQSFGSIVVKLPWSVAKEWLETQEQQIQNQELTMWTKLLVKHLKAATRVLADILNTYFNMEV